MLVKIVASSILILAVLVVRAVFQKKVNPLFLYPIWLIVALRLLLPGMLFFSPLSIMNTGLWDAGSRMIRQENERQDTLYKQQKFQAYYEKKEAEASVFLREGPEADVKEAAEKDAPGREAGQNTEREGNTETYELKQNRPATLFGKIRQGARMAWAIGMAFFTLTFGWRNLCFYRYLRRTRKKWADYPVGRRKIPVFTAGDKLASPCLFGLFPAVYVPASGDEAALSMALEHEAVHYRHGDHIWAFVRILCLITNWYNPLVWVCAILSVRDGELACDAGCIRRLGEEKRSAYGEALIAMIRQTKKRESLFRYAAMMTSGKKFMAKRIESIAQSRKGSKVSLSAMVLILLFCAGCTYTGAGQSEETSEPSRTASTGTDAVLQEQTVLEDVGTGADKQKNADPGSGAVSENEQVRYSGKAVVLKDRQESISGNLEEKIFLLTPGDGQQGESSNIVLLTTELYVPDLEGNMKKLDEICRSCEKEEILEVLNSSMDLNLNEIEVLGYDSFIQKVDGAGGIPVDVTESEIDHINNYQLMMTGEERLGENEVTETGTQILNGIQTAAYLQIRYHPGGHRGMMDRWKQVVPELLKAEGVSTDNCYEQFFSGRDKAVYVEGQKKNYLLCFQWEEAVKELHDILYPAGVYRPSGHVKELDAAMKEQAERDVSDYRHDISKIRLLFGEYIGESPYMISLLRGETLGQETEKAWDSIEVYESGIGIKEDEDNGRAVFTSSLAFEDSGILDFPGSGGGEVTVERFLYLIKREDGWYVDGPLHNNLPPANWWQGDEISWESYDFGFSDEDSPGVVTEGQEEYNSFIKAVREAVEN